MDNHNVATDRLNLVAIVCLIVAAKIEDIDPIVPKMTEIHTFVNVNYDPSEFTSVERMILRFFDFDLMIPTTATYIEAYIEAAIIYADLDQAASSHRQATLNGCKTLYSLKQIYALEVFSFLDLTLANINLGNYSPSVVAAAILAAARSSLKLFVWPSVLTSITQYRYDDIKEVFVLVCKLKTTSQERRKCTPESGYLSDVVETDSDMDDEVMNDAKKPCH